MPNTQQARVIYHKLHQTALYTNGNVLYRPIRMSDIFFGQNVKKQIIHTPSCYSTSTLSVVWSLCCTDIMKSIYSKHNFILKYIQITVLNIIIWHKILYITKQKLKQVTRHNCIKQVCRILIKITFVYVICIKRKEKHAVTICQYDISIYILLTKNRAIHTITNKKRFEISNVQNIYL